MTSGKLIEYCESRFFHRNGILFCQKEKGHVDLHKWSKQKFWWEPYETSIVWGNEKRLCEIKETL